MDNYELKELKVLLEIKIKLSQASSLEKELYYKVIEKLGKDNVYNHVEAALLDNGYIKRIDQDLVLGKCSNGVKRVTYEPFYVLTDKGISKYKKMKREYERPKIKWGIILEVLGLVASIIGLLKCAE